MPRFAELNLLFIHIPKNAGRSVEQALLRDKASPDGGRRSVLSRFSKLLQNFSASQFAEERLIGTIDRSFAAQHLTFGEMEMLGLIAEETPFAVVRNPFDRAVSSVFHFRQGGSSAAPSDPADFETMLEHWLDRSAKDHNDRAHRRTQHDFVINMQGQIAVPHLLRFENLQDDFAQFLDARGISGINLPQRGKSKRIDGYRDYFTPNARALVEREYARDLEHFKYVF